MFLGLGLSGIIPTLHYVISEGFLKAATIGQIGWLLLMASLYITGAALYAARIPERFFPGKCDIWVSTAGGISACAYLSVAHGRAGGRDDQNSPRLGAVLEACIPHRLCSWDSERIAAVYWLGTWCQHRARCLT